ncbi:hybrid sensor histidine kinase/response regulator transcription factor [Larkinella rosea]|uniref:histidine kinase n=1 Tax=Larkinella rosea TaxID=2025312 RepID=A0A3P1BUU7_9BACT|nr:hybrid sensor histidine kinase/response regulator transcription factor [Larkinella rosea]RRB04679.1 hybrid sensor histidine kinase/response regulator [Larkinella rosea]
MTYLTYKARFWLGVLTNFLLLPAGFCQPDGQTFSHLGVDDGLSQSSVYAIAQDNHGFMWFGTRDGLNRYDSRRVAVYKNQTGNPQSLASNTVNSLLRDKRGRLWVGTTRGLALFRPETDDFQRFSFGNSQDSTIISLAEDSRGHIWVGTLHGLYRLRTEKPYWFERLAELTQNRLDLKNQHVRTLYEDRERNLWVGTTGGLVQLRPMPSGKFQLTPYFLEPADSKFHNAFNGINAIAEDRAGRLWLGTERHGIALFDSKLGRVTSWTAATGLDLKTQTIRTIQADGKSNFWIGTMSGLYIVAQDGSRFRALTNQPTDPGSLSDNSVRSVFRDRDGSVWVGSYYGGVDLYSPLARQFGSYRPMGEKGGMPFKIAGPMLPANASNQRWLGTEDRGLFLLNADKTVARHYVHNPKNSQSLSNDKVKCLLADGTTGLWVGTLQGLNYLDLRRQTITRYLHEPNNPNSLPNDRIYDLKRDADGTLWVVTNLGGLCRFEPKTQSFIQLGHRSEQKNSLSSNNAMSLLIDSQQQLWVGTTNGLNRKLPNEDGFVHFFHDDQNPASISNSHVTCFLEDRQRRLWVGTRDGGLNLLLPDQRSFRHYTMAQGLPSNTVFGIREDRQGRLWISTDNGLAQLDPVQSKIVSYNKHDGLVSKEFTSNSTYQDASGYFYFGGYNGIVQFHPDSIRRNTTPPRLAFTQLRLFNEPVTGLSSEGIDYERGLTLTHRQNVFSLDFAAFNYINSSKNRYAYQLRGFDDGWNYVSEPRAMYMNLAPGEYVLRVNGANNDGVWNPKPLELKITVLPPIWKTGWAYLLYALTFIGLLALWSRFNRNRLRLAHELEVEQNEKNRQQELHQTKLNFFTEIAHEIRTPLTLVMGPIEVLSTHKPNDAFLQKQLAIMRGSTDRLLRLLNQLLDFRKHETGHSQLQKRETDLVAFLEKITASFLEHARSRQVTLLTESEVTKLPVWIDAGEMEKVVYNLLLNAFKFTPAGGTISVRVQQDFGESDAENKAVITVGDTGSGIPADELDPIFNPFYQVNPSRKRDSGFGLGLALSKSIVEQHQGQITVESRESVLQMAGFTRFTITLPALPPDCSEAVPSGLSTEIEFPSGHPTALTKPADEWVEKEEEGSVSGKTLILVVEDQDDIRAYIRDLFAETAQVIEAADGAVAWEKAAQLLPDLIITDVAMPKMDGFALTNRIKSDPRTSHIPVIMLTAKGTTDDQLTGLQTGADDYVTKPFHPVLLQARVRNLLLLREQLKAKYHRIVTLQPQEQQLDHPDDKFLNQLMSVLNANLSNADFNVTSLVGEMGMSRPVLFRKVKMLTGLSVIDLLRTTRLKKAEILLKQKKASVSEIAFAVGFGDPRYFSRAFRAQFGVTPTEYASRCAEVAEVGVH